jgi:hypothetical protein
VAWVQGLVWGLIACLMCVTLIFIPCGLQLFKVGCSAPPSPFNLVSCDPTSNPV